MVLSHRISTSFSTQLTLWVSGIVIAIYVVVIILLARFSQQVVLDESIETTMQVLENNALRVNNTLRQADMTAFLEHQEFIADKAMVERLIHEKNYFVTLNKSLPHARLVVADCDTCAYSSYIVNPDGGYERTVIDGEDSFLFYEPFYNHRFSLIVICPVEDIFAPFKPVQMFILITGLAGLLLVIFFCWKVISHHLRPLHFLADSAQLIADGHIAVKVPDSGMKNEIGQLQNSFATMQLSLANYMDEMQQKQVKLGQQNSELEKAYHQAQEYENLKKRFLSNMADQIVRPIDSVCLSTDKICNNYQSMTREEVELTEASILSETESVIKLLEQMFNVTDAAQ